MRYIVEGRMSDRWQDASILVVNEDRQIVKIIQ